MDGWDGMDGIPNIGIRTSYQRRNALHGQVSCITQTSFTVGNAQKLTGKRRVHSFYFLFDQEGLVSHKISVKNLVDSFFSVV